MQHDLAHEEKQNKALRALAHELEALGARGVLSRVDEILGADEAEPTTAAFTSESPSARSGTPLYAPPKSEDA
jgi:hypothetical protein